MLRLHTHTERDRTHIVKDYSHTQKERNIYKSNVFLCSLMDIWLDMRETKSQKFVSLQLTVPMRACSGIA